MHLPPLMIWDTSMLCVLLQVPDMDTCTHDGQPITPQMVQDRFAAEQQQGTKFILPMAVVIEAGNHIAQISGNEPRMRQILQVFISMVTDAIRGNSPWLIFGEQQDSVFNDDTLVQMMQEWQAHIHSLSFGDLTIKYVADFYAATGREVIIFTCDEKLRAYSPARVEIIVPRRNRR
jgi:hypothetical protein